MPGCLDFVTRQVPRRCFTADAPAADDPCRGSRAGRWDAAAGRAFPRAVTRFSVVNLNQNPGNAQDTLEDFSSSTDE